MMGVGFRISGRRGLGGAQGGGGEGEDPYLPPASESVVLTGSTVTKLLDSTGKSLKKRQGIVSVLRNITFTGTITSVRVQVSVNGTFKTGASDYEYTGFDDDGQTAVTSADGFIATQHTTPTDIAFRVDGLGLLGPTHFESWDMTVSSTLSETFAGTRQAAEINDGIRVIFNGTSVNLTGGTWYLGYY